MSKKMLMVLNVVLIAILGTGCSVSKVQNLPSKKNMNILTEGQFRSLVRAEFGQPIDIQEVEDGYYETYAFNPGYSGASKFFRGLGYTAAAVYTLGVSEAITNPLESAISDRRNTVIRVRYHEDDTVAEFMTLQEAVQ